MLPSTMHLKTHVKNVLKQRNLHGNIQTIERATLQDFVHKIIIEYFNLTLNLHPKTIHTPQTLIELQRSTFGVIHISSAAKDPSLTKCLITSFHALIQPTTRSAQTSYTNHLGLQIQENRDSTKFFYDRALSNHLKKDWPAFQQEEIEATSESATILKSSQVGIGPLFLPDESFSLATLRDTHRQLFLSVYILLYLEYLVSISNAPKERIEILSMIYKNASLLGTSIAKILENKNALIHLQQQLSLTATTINEAHLQSFLNKRVSNPALYNILYPLILKYPSDIQTGIPLLVQNLQNYPLTQLITEQFSEFNTGTSLLYIGHEHTVPPNLVGLIGTLMDCACDFQSIQTINMLFEQLPNNASFETENLEAFYPPLQQMALITTPLIEKKKLVETYRSAFFPWHQRFIESLSNMNDTQHLFMKTLSVEVSFTHVLSNTDCTAQILRSIQQNQIAMRILREEKNLSLEDYYTKGKQAISQEIFPSNLTDIENKLSLIWELQNMPNDHIEITPALVDNKPNTLSRLKKMTRRVFEKIVSPIQQAIPKNLFDRKSIVAALGATGGILLAIMGILPPIGGSVVLCLLIAAIIGITAGLICNGFISTIQKKLLAQQKNDPVVIATYINAISPASSYANFSVLMPGSPTQHSSQTTRWSTPSNKPSAVHFCSELPTAGNHSKKVDDDRIEDRQGRLEYF